MSPTMAAPGSMRLSTGGYDAIILDLMLPVLSGYEVVRRLRAAEVWTPVLMLTAKDGEYDEADALDEGADDYLTKPFSLVVLVARIRALLRRGVTARPTVMRSGSVEVDPGTRRVLRDGREVEITAREFALLSYLSRHAGRVVSKGELYEHVWESHDPGSRAQRGRGLRRLPAPQARARRRRDRAGRWLPRSRTPRLMRRWSRVGLRARLTLIATAALAVGLAAGSLLLLHGFATSRLHAIDGSSRNSADNLANLVAAGALPPTLPVQAGQSAQVLNDRGLGVGGISGHLPHPAARPGDRGRCARAAVAHAAVDVDQVAATGINRVLVRAVNVGRTIRTMWS